MRPTLSAAIYAWPRAFKRVPRQQWTHAPVEPLALNYDSVSHHGWYRNLEPTIRQLERHLKEGDLLVDYSGGTGILLEKVLASLPEIPFGAVLVDSSPKFLRLALEKLGHEERVAFRLIRYLKTARRLQYVDEVLGPLLVERKADYVVSTNALHLYYDLVPTLRSWRRILRPDGRVFAQSGNIRNPEAPRDLWIIDETVEAVHEAAMRIVRSRPGLAAHRARIDDPARRDAYDRLRRKFFLPVRPLDHYADAFRQAGFRVVEVRAEPIEADVEEWFQFLSVYHEGILGWVGGVEKIDGAPASADDVRERLGLIREALGEIFHGRETFQAVWTYLTCAPE